MNFAIVIPTIGRPTLDRLLMVLERAEGPRPDAVIVVDDRPDPHPPLLTVARLPVTVLRSGGRGPAAARNVGWRQTTARWVCFLDDDVLPHPGWLTALAEDLARADAAGAAGCQATIDVPAQPWRRSTNDDQRTLRLADAQWITADMAYRRSALVCSGGFDERFPRATARIPTWHCESRRRATRSSAETGAPGIRSRGHRGSAVCEPRSATATMRSCAANTVAGGALRSARAAAGCRCTS
ncbi:glycosyltransferase family 2 protein [Mycolicibacterium mageritense]|uniref:glycosyltransferase family 2 protein n=1 Tax=Mycolicibacterium mageritense TaxID=53462 RepID=UPI001E567A85|nr:glycosyltransferase [Mycolicibacterium mageritense]MCC9182853.1 glycosyltransferase family 2 protein [Mycolicibacterium mageritense]